MQVKQRKKASNLFIYKFTFDRPESWLCNKIRYRSGRDVKSVYFFRPYLDIHQVMHVIFREKYKPIEFDVGEGAILFPEV